MRLAYAPAFFIGQNEPSFDLGFFIGSTFRAPSKVSTNITHFQSSLLGDVSGLVNNFAQTTGTPLSAADNSGRILTRGPRMEKLAFPIENLTDQDLEFCVRLAHSQREVPAFWKPFGATCAMAQAERLLHGKDVVAFIFPEDLSVQDAALLHNELLIVRFKIEPHGSDALRTLIEAIGITAARAAEARALLN